MVGSRPKLFPNCSTCAVGGQDGRGSREGDCLELDADSRQAEIGTILVKSNHLPEYALTEQKR